MDARIIKFIGITLFTLAIGVTTLQTFRPVFPEGILYGTTVARSRPSLTWSTWWQGEFQAQFESWIADRIGFKSFWVRTENQINFSLNRRITTAANAAGTKVILGKENWLYEKSYVDAYLGRRSLVPPHKIEPVVWGIQQLQAKLAARGIAFLLVVSPSKAVTYPEYLPARLAPEAPLPGAETNYRRTRAILEEYGIHWVDTPTLFAQLKSPDRYPLFAKGGTHWNHYSAYRVIEAMIHSLNPRMARAALPLPRLAAVELTAPQGADTDLGSLINIWTSRATEAPTPYPHVETPAASAKKRPDILITGSSFVWTLIDQLTRADLYATMDFLYYYNRRVSYPGAVETTFDATQADWQTLLLAKDAVIIEINEASLPHFDTRFIKDALTHLN